MRDKTAFMVTDEFLKEKYFNSDDVLKRCVKKMCKTFKKKEKKL